MASTELSSMARFVASSFLPSERKLEAQAIETRYAKLNDRTFPVAVIFLMPASMLKGEVA